LRSVRLRRPLAGAGLQLPAPPDARSQGRDPRAPGHRKAAGAGTSRQLAEKQEGHPSQEDSMSATRSKKSTNGRLFIARAGVRALTAIAPPLGDRLAMELFYRPRRTRQEPE